MKQEIITYLSTLRDEIFSLSEFLYQNPEDNFKEYNSYKYIIKLLKKYNFKVSENFLDIPTAFSAQFGEGHPKVCYICKYSAPSDLGHIFGNNISCAMSIGAALGLSKVIPKTSGSAIVLGCPGDSFNGAELTMTKQGIFEDMDIIIAPYAYLENFESGTSMTIIPMEIEYCSKNLIYENADYSPLQGCLFTFNAISHLVKSSCAKCSVDGLLVEGSRNPYTYPNKAKAKFYIRSCNMKEAEILEKKIKDFTSAINPIFNLEGKISLFQLPCEELITNKALSRVFSHNLKESGVIDIMCCKDTSSGLSIGSVSHTTPCIYPSISIVEDKNIKYPSPEFAKATLTDFAKQQIMRTTQALAITGLDIIQSEELLKEMTSELFNK